MADAKIKVDETNLEDLIILGEDKLINITIQFPTDNGQVNAKAKIKQLTMKELKNINLDVINLETNIKILTKCLYRQDETPFQRNMIEALPVGVVNAISAEILRISGVNTTDIKKQLTSIMES